MNKHDRMYARIEKHGRQLITLFNLPANTDPVQLCKKLRTLEMQAGHVATQWCNGTASEHDFDMVVRRVIGKLDKLLGYKAAGIPVFINSDPRGYALKIRAYYMDENRAELYRDMGGYGIIAPDLTND